MNCRFTGSIADGAETSLDLSGRSWPVIPPDKLYVKYGGTGAFGMLAGPTKDGCEYRLVGTSADGFHNYVAPSMLDHDRMIMSTQNDNDVVY